MLKAIADRLIVKPDKTLPSVLVGVETEKKFTNQGVVQSVGDKVTMASVGEHIIFHRFDELPLPQNDLVVIREKSLLGKISE